jgi:dTDP-4-dehydrorhamnose 3,5-epimerase
MIKATETSLPGVLVIDPIVHGDDRGFFFESFHKRKYAELGVEADFVQTNISRSSRGVLRGLHYQFPHPQGKLVTVLEGEVYDVAVDIRPSSATFGQWTAVMLSATNRRHFWIPPGFAHGFCVVSDAATFMYQCTTLYDAAADAAIHWDDPSIGIDWPVSDPILSRKDELAPRLADVARERLPDVAS